MKEEKAAAHQASRKPILPSWLCVFSLLALTFYAWRAVSALAPRPVVLHAVPESELVAVSLPVNPELFSSAVKTTGKRVVFGKPTEPPQLPSDFLPPSLGGAVAKLVAALPPSIPPPSPPPPPEGPKPWVVEAQLPPRPKNASRAAAAMARAAAATRAARAAPPLRSDDGTLSPMTDAVQQLALAPDERLTLVPPPADGDATATTTATTTSTTTAAAATAAAAAAAAGVYAYEVLDARPGTVLIGGDGAFSEETNYYNGAVVLLLKVCGCRPSIFGVILNRETAHTMADEFCPRSAAAYPALANNTVHLGGPVGPYWNVLSPRPTAGGFEIAPGMGMHVVGSLAQAHAAVQRGEMHSSDINFFSGYAAWPIERLNQEIADGKWKVARASKALLASGLASGTLHQLLEAQLR